MIKKEKFGTMSDGREVNLFTLYNSSCEYVQLLDYGASIHSIYVLDKDGKLGDVVLGVDNADELEGRSYEGVTIGRCANRIAYGKFTIDGVETRLECNRGGHFIHGGSGNYANKTFAATMDEAQNCVTFRLVDTGEGGFGCYAEVAVTFTFDDNHELGIQYNIMPHGDTVICPTNHAYINLSGTGDIRDHLLKIYANYFAPKGEIGMPMGDRSQVIGTPLDFIKTRRIGEAMKDDLIGFFSSKPCIYDDSYILDKSGFGLAAELYSGETGRIMHVYTDMPALIAFTPYAKDMDHGKGGVFYTGYCAICLETQYIPNAVNCPQYTSPIFRVNELLHSKTVYVFNVVHSEG
ncbi:MAG: aldose epimerase family protein [Mobilitalea sp.]